MDQAGMNPTTSDVASLRRQIADLQQQIERLKAGNRASPEGAEQFGASRELFETLAESSPDVTMLLDCDGTEAKKASIALMESQREYKTLLTAIPDLLMRLRRDGMFVWARAPRDFPLLLPLEDAIGQYVIDVMPPDVARQAMEKVALTLVTREMQLFQYSLDFDSQTTHWEARMVPSGDDEVLVMVRDETHRRRAEQQRDDYFRLTDAIRRIQTQYISRSSNQEIYDDVLSELLAMTNSQ
jgi:PAS domain-containing protein